MKKLGWHFSFLLVWIQLWNKIGQSISYLLPTRRNVLSLKTLSKKFNTSLINIDDIKVQKNDDHDNKIKIGDDLMMVMKYPSLDQFIKNNFDFEDKNAMDQSFELIASCIDTIFTEDEAWSTADCSKKEVTEFLESMNSSQFKGIEKFFETMPKLSHKVKVKNPKTKVESEVVLEGLASFFA